jgi:dipeptidase D
VVQTRRQHEGGGAGLHLERANALKLLGRILWETREEVPFTISDLNGGDKHNAIPREASAVLVTEDPDSLKKVLKENTDKVREVYKTVEPEMYLKSEDAELPERSMSDEDTKKVLNAIFALPNGIQRWSPDVEDMVETSTNLSVVKCEEKVFLHLSSRSSSEAQLESLREMIKAIARMVDAEVEEPEPYPGWQPDMESKVLAVLKEAGEELWGKQPEVKAIHAGLETGIIGEKFPGMDMAAIGPQIEYPHSPDERVRIPSVKDFYELLVLALEKLA